MPLTACPALSIVDSPRLVLVCPLRSAPSRLPSPLLSTLSSPLSPPLRSSPLPPLSSSLVSPIPSRSLTVSPKLSLAYHLTSACLAGALHRQDSPAPTAARSWRGAYPHARHLYLRRGSTKSPGDSLPVLAAFPSLSLPPPFRASFRLATPSFILTSPPPLHSHTYPSPLTSRPTLFPRFTNFLLSPVCPTNPPYRLASRPPSPSSTSTPPSTARTISGSISPSPPSAGWRE